MGNNIRTREAKPKTILLKNSFHNTEIRIKFKSWMNQYNPLDTYMFLWYRATHTGIPEHKLRMRQVRRIQKKLCGAKDCGCGTVRP